MTTRGCSADGEQPRRFSGVANVLQQLLKNGGGIAADALVIRLSQLPSFLNDPELSIMAHEASKRILTTLAASDIRNLQTIQECVSTDPVNLLLAIGTIPDLAIRSGCVREYQRIESEFQTASIKLFSPGNAPLATYLLQHLAGVSVPSVSLAGIPEQITGPSIAGFALMISEMGRVRIRCTSTLLQASLRASLLRSARKRDLIDVGLLLIAHSILFPNDDIAFITDWLSKIRRTDGLFGTWDLFPGSVSIANLLSSVTIGWSLDVQSKAILAQRQSGPIRWVEAVDLPQMPAESEIDKAVSRIFSWIDGHLERFNIFGGCKDLEDYGNRIKPLVELALLAWLAFSVSKDTHSPELEAHSKHIANKLVPHLKWEGFLEGLRIFPTAVLGALLIPLLEDVVGPVCPFRAEVEALAEDRFSAGQERIPMRQMDYWFMRWLFNKDQAHIHELDSCCKKSLLSYCANPILFSNDALYDITHAIFYASHFGGRQPQFSSDVRAWLNRHFDDLTLSCLLDGDSDLGAEFMMCQVYWGTGKTPLYGYAARLLVNSVSEDGSVEPPHGVKDEKLDKFERCYHTTLVALAALLETKRTSRAVTA